MTWLRRFLGVSREGKARLTIVEPRLGFLNLQGPDATPLLAEDRAALSSLFTSIAASDLRAPVCDVLLMYCSIRADGCIDASARGIKELILAAGATIVIVASPNEAASYIAARKREGPWNANVVMTLDRKNAAFGTFFARLFSAMYTGSTMASAWIGLAPQVSGAVHAESPESILACEATDITFSHG
jgi:hypothetical protein